jgi:hypothetical protein
MNRSMRALPFGALLIAFALLCEPALSMGITLTQEQLTHLLKVVDKEGSHATVPGSVAGLLELYPKQLAPDIKQVVYRDEDGNKHGFAPLNDGSGFFMFRAGASFGQSVYRVDEKMHLVRAARSLVKNGPLLPLAPNEAQKELDDEFARWSKVLSPNGPSAPLDFPFKKSAGSPEGPAAPQDFPFGKSGPAKP